MDSYDVGEIYVLVVNYTLSKLGNITSKDNIGFFRDDRLILLRELNWQQTDKMRKNIIKVFKTIGLQTEIEISLQ